MDFGVIFPSPVVTLTTSVPSYMNEWFWWDWKGAKNPRAVLFMEENYKPDFTYADFAPQFKAEFYEPYKWADIFKASGAK